MVDAQHSYTMVDAQHSNALVYGWQLGGTVVQTGGTLECDAWREIVLGGVVF